MKKAFKDSSFGRRSYQPLALFEVLPQLQGYGLSDTTTEEAIADRISLRRFLGLSLVDVMPDDTSIPVT